ncbi:MAG TPA: N-acetylmuramoyl-L-alanine amidase [Opitutaceae bacterium]|jgi:N-acetylmuramoyl-L-alanine amidase
MRLAAIGLLIPLGLLAAPPDEGLPSIRNGGVEYVSLSEGAQRLGLKLERSVPSSAAMMKDGDRPVARFSSGSRDADIHGMRLFLGDAVIERGSRFYMSRIDFDDRLVPRLRPDLCGPPPRVPHVVAIDAGHGGVDHGTENHSYRSMEKTYTLDVAQRLKRLLEAAGFRVVMTREGDVTVDKERRSEIANLGGADVFISIHFNSLYPNTRTTGVETLSFPPRTQRSTDSHSPGKLNDSEQSASPENRFDPWDAFLAGYMHRALLAAMKTGDRGEKLEHLGVLRGLNCPGVLLESAFLSSDTEAQRLATPEFRDRIAEAMLDGIRQYDAAVRALQPPSVTGPGPSAPTRLPPTRPSQGR